MDEVRADAGGHTAPAGLEPATSPYDVGRAFHLRYEPSLSAFEEVIRSLYYVVNGCIATGAKVR